jgi:hypothetical protein
MKQDSVWLKIVLSLPPVFFLVLHLADLIDVFSREEGYPFGSEFFSKASIYKSRDLYIGFGLLATIFLLITLFLIWKEKWKWLIVIAIIDIAFIIYPMMTNE